jgi:hypothetical protein
MQTKAVANIQTVLEVSASSASGISLYSSWSTVINSSYPTSSLRLELGEATRAILERPRWRLPRSWAISTIISKSINPSFTTPITSRTSTQCQINFIRFHQAKQALGRHSV